MKKQALLISFFCIILTIFYISPVYANLIWPALFISNSILSAWFLIIISIAIEGIILHEFIKTITYKKAMVMSLLGNVASAVVGTVAMPMAMLLWHLVFDFILGATFNPINVIASYILMFWGSCFVELMTLQDLFGYSKKQLWIPILVGNFTTYVLTAMYQFSAEIAKLVGF